jgi:hypothetical protein
VQIKIKKKSKMWGQQVDGAFLFAIDPLHDEA